MSRRYYDFTDPLAATSVLVFLPGLFALFGLTVALNVTFTAA